MANPADPGGGAPRPRVRGMLLSARLRFVRHRWGKAALERALAVLAEEDRQRAEGPDCDVDWFDLTVLSAVERWVVERHGGEPRHVLLELGQWSAEHSFVRVAPLFRGLGPREAVARVARLGLQFQDFGDVEWGELPHERGADRMWLAYRYPESVPPDYCASGAGYLGRLLELLGFDGVDVEEVACQARGDRTHRYELSWLWPVSRTATPSRAARDDRAAPTRVHSRTGQSTVGSGVEFRRGRRRLAGLLMIALALAATLLRPSPRAATAPAAEPIAAYRCEGDAPVEVAFDSPVLLLRSSADLADVAVEAVGEGRVYKGPTQAIAAGVWFEIGPEELHSRDGASSRGTRPPAVVRVQARRGSDPVACECRRQ